MLKKNRPIKFTRSGTIMERVFQAVLDGHTAKMRIVVATSLPYQRVSTALYALTYAGNLQAHKQGNVFRYSLPGEPLQIEASDLQETMRIFYASSTEK